MKKTISIVLSIISLTMLLLTPTSAAALPLDIPLTQTENSLTSNNECEILHLYPLQDGSFSILTSQYSLPTQRSSASVTVQSKNSGNQVYFDITDEESIFMRISETRLIPAQEIQITDMDIASINELASRHLFSNLLIDDLRKIAERSSAGEIEVQSLAVYIPGGESVSRQEGIVSRRTYTGYMGKKYYEEVLEFNGNSLPFNVVQPNSAFQNYIENVLSAAAETLIDTALNAATGDKWTLLTVFAQSDISQISTTEAVEHTSALIENKYRKYTYIYEYDGADMMFGSMIDNTYEYRFKNYLNVPGEDIIEGDDTPNQSCKAEGYTNADQYAYQWYLTSGYQNTISRYSYKNEDENVHTYVESLF